MKKSYPVQIYKKLPSWSAAIEAPESQIVNDRLEPSTCIEAEPFALQVLDESMSPEFAKGCIIVVDPTGRATDGSYVLVRTGEKTGDISDSEQACLESVIFRQLHKTDSGHWLLKALNRDLQLQDVPCELSTVVGVIVQRAGARRRDHKRYDTV